MRRKSPRVVWLPPDRFNCLGATGGATSLLQNGIKRIVFGVPGGTGSSHTEVIPIVADAQVDLAILTGDSLADITNSAYRLRRIVGKVFCGMQQTENSTTTQVIVTAGLIVLRARQDGTGQIVPLNPTTEEYSTQMLQNWSDPWIWRRSWVFSNLPRTFASGTESYAETNQGYGSVLDGPHVDAKTARIVGPEERLFFVITGSSDGGDPQETLTVRCYLDLRVLASMRTSQGNRRNASR